MGHVLKLSEMNSNVLHKCRIDRTPIQRVMIKGGEGKTISDAILLSVIDVL